MNHLKLFIQTIALLLICRLQVKKIKESPAVEVISVAGESKKTKRKFELRLFTFFCVCGAGLSLRSGNLAVTQTTRANCYGLGCTVNNCLYLANIGLPRSVGLTVRVGNGLSENDALSADAALCHIDTSLCVCDASSSFQFIEHCLLYHRRKENARVFWKKFNFFSFSP